MPIDEAERHAETARVDNPEDERRPDEDEDNGIADDEDAEEEDMGEAEAIKARRA